MNNRSKCSAEIGQTTYRPSRFPQNSSISFRMPPLRVQVCGSALLEPRNSCFSGSETAPMVLQRSKKHVRGHWKPLPLCSEVNTPWTTTQANRAMGVGLVDGYLEHGTKHLKPASATLYEMAFGRHLKPLLGNRNPKPISPRTSSPKHRNRVWHSFPNHSWRRR